MRRVLITGVAGMIGSALALRLLQSGHEVIGIDNNTSEIGHKRLKQIVDHDSFDKYFGDVAQTRSLVRSFRKIRDIDTVVHLAARAGVRDNEENCVQCMIDNVVGTASVFEMARELGIVKVIYASSSSVYGDTQDFRETPAIEGVTETGPISAYAASKLACESLAKQFIDSGKLRTAIGLRFFTVYGPWNRPDMAASIFGKKILNGEEIELFNEGENVRDWTSLGDVTRAIQSIVELNEYSEKFRSLGSDLFNVCCGNPIRVLDAVEIMAEQLGKPGQAKVKLVPRQSGDVLATRGCSGKLKALTGWQPQDSFEYGYSKVAKWLKEEAENSME